MTEKAQALQAFRAAGSAPGNVGIISGQFLYVFAPALNTSFVVIISYHDSHGMNSMIFLGSSGSCYDMNHSLTELVRQP